MEPHRIIGLAAVAFALSACAPTHPGSQGYTQSIQQPPHTTVVSAMCTSVNGRADARCNPGLFSHDAEVTADAPRYLHTLCAPPPPPGQKTWIQKRRPSDAYTNNWKQREMAAYGITDPDPGRNIEEDHIAPLELDGDTGHTIGSKGLPVNLFPQRRARAGASPLTSAEDKDREEDLLHRQVCSGALTLEQAQQKIIRDWVR